MPSGPSPQVPPPRAPACGRASPKLTPGKAETKVEATQARGPGRHPGLASLLGATSPCFEFLASQTPQPGLAMQDHVATVWTGEVGSLNRQLQVGKLSPNQVRLQAQVPQGVAMGGQVLCN